MALVAVERLTTAVKAAGLRSRTPLDAAAAAARSAFRILMCVRIMNCPHEAGLGDSLRAPADEEAWNSGPIGR
jgi:hypothetical protein